MVDKITEILATLFFIGIVGYMFYDFHKKEVMFRKKQKEEEEREKLYERYKIEAIVKYNNYLKEKYQHGKI